MANRGVEQEAMGGPETDPPTEALVNDAPVTVETRAVDTGCGVGIGCTVVTLLIMLIGIAIIVVTRW